MQRNSSGDLEANRTALSTSILRNSERIASAIANTINNNAITVSRPNLGTHCTHIRKTHLQQTHAVSCNDIVYIYTYRMPILSISFYKCIYKHSYG